MLNTPSITDQALANWASNGAAERAFTALELGFLIRDLGPMCHELIAMRAADPLDDGETAPERATDAELQHWAMCLEANPGYRLTEGDQIALPFLVSGIAAELLIYRNLIRKKESDNATLFRQAVTARARRSGSRDAIAAE